MTRLDRYRDLQRSVPGLADMYDTIGGYLASACSDATRLLIVGAGGGREVELIARTAATPHVTALDPSAENLAEARKLATDLGMSRPPDFVTGLTQDLPSSARFDLVTVIFVLHVIGDRARELDTLRAVRARLRPGGRVLLADMCFDEGADRDAMAASYRDHARSLGTANRLIELELSAARQNRDRTKTRLGALLADAGLRDTRELAVAHWYRCMLLRA